MSLRHRNRIGSGSTRQVSTWLQNGAFTVPSTYPPNCVHYYKLDGDFLDSAGSYNLSYAGSPSGVSGLLNTAWNFPSGSSDYAYYDTVDWMSGNYTVSAWFKTVNAAGAIVWFNGSPNLWMMLNGSGNMYFHSNDGQDLYGSAVLTDGGWHHVVMSCTSGSVSCYVDGSSVGTLGSTGTTFSDFCLGTWKDNPGYNPCNNMVIDEVAMFNRGIDSTEVAALYNGGAGLAFS